MEVTISHNQGRVPVTVFRVDGDIDSLNHEELERIVFQEIEAGTRYVVFDLSTVPFISSAGFRTFMKVFKRLRGLSEGISEEDSHKEINTGAYKSPHLKLFKPNKLVAGTLKIAGFNMLLEVHEDMQTAITSFQASGIPSR
ncbi:MAG: STAS domain-containing protein [Anaerolineales bacterium]|jgi:anti-anti-sigma factor